MSPRVCALKSQEQLSLEILGCALAAHRTRLKFEEIRSTVDPTELPQLAEEIEEIANICLALAEDMASNFVSWRHEGHASPEQKA